MKIPLPEATAPNVSNEATFCCLPWSHLRVVMDGSFSPCCASVGYFTRPDGRQFKIYDENGMEDVWNSDAMRELRKDLATGRMSPWCNNCWEAEATGGPSPRTLANGTWINGNYGNHQLLSIAEFTARAAQDDYRVKEAPYSLNLEVGNQCNLKCRMCSGFSSTRIARDEVHSRWANEWSPVGEEGWIKKPSLIRDELLRHVDQLRYINFYGGETFLVKEVGDALQVMVDAGVADQITVCIQTNGTTAKAPFLKLSKHFQVFDIAVSLDGFGQINEYIRYPARWSSVVDTIQALTKLPNARVSVSSTVQAYNALYLVDLFRFSDVLKIPFYANPLFAPVYLGARVLPQPVRQVAAERLAAYADSDCLTENRDHVLALVAFLNPEGTHPDEMQLNEFMQFTNDMDISRQQSIHDAEPELIALLEEAGYPWSYETRHVHQELVSLDYSS